jgi:hypothetical protein
LRRRCYIANREVRRPTTLHLHLRNELISINTSRHLLLKHRRRCVNWRWSVYRWWWLIHRRRRCVNRLWWRRINWRRRCYRRIATKEVREA